MIDNLIHQLLSAAVDRRELMMLGFPTTSFLIISGGLLTTLMDPGRQAELVHITLVLTLNTKQWLESRLVTRASDCLPLADQCGGRKWFCLQSLWPFMTSVSQCGSAGSRIKWVFVWRGCLSLTNVWGWPLRNCVNGAAHVWLMNCFWSLNQKQ